MPEVTLKEVLSGTYRSTIFNEIKKQPEKYFDEALCIYLDGDTIAEWRAANILYVFVKKNDQRIIPHLDQIISKLASEDKSVLRETLRLLLKFKFNDEQEGQLFDYCSELWLNILLPPGLRYYALKHLSLIAIKYPELKQEVLLLTQQDYIDPLSPGVKHSVKKLIKELNK